MNFEGPNNQKKFPNAEENSHKTTFLKLNVLSISTY